MSPPSSSAPPATFKTTTMVGFNGYMEQLLDQLTGQQSGLQILSIVGMGGIGKTTLARNVYQNLLIVDHFDVRAWVTVSEEYSARYILLQALSCLGGFTILSRLGGSTSKMDKTDEQLGEELYKILYGRRYLIVLDDVWSVEAWEKIMAYFPENNNGSRIIATTRQSELVDYFGSSALAVDFLDDKNSWDLFCEKAFAQEGCPPELEQVGKKIVKNCKGLPLAIIVIGGLLGKSSRTQEYWEKFANDKSLILDSGEGNKASSILYLSYKHLPVWLKSCLLYLGLFPEDYKIAVAKLIKLWVADGFIKPNANNSLEEVAESYIKDLADRNLLLVHCLNKKFQSCHVHDLVRDLCIRIAEKEKFLFIQRDIDGMRQYIVDERTARFYPPESHVSKTPSIVNPRIFQGKRKAPFKSRLLRVLVRDMDQLHSTFQQVNLRYLCNEYHTTYANLPSSLSLLWSLQTLIVTGSSFVAPPEIWKMPQLRHIDIWSLCLPDPPPPSSQHDDVIVLPNLQTLKRVENLILTEDVCKRIPNIKDLQIDYYFDMPGGKGSCYPLHNVGCLNKLESLQYSFWGLECGSLQNLKLPNSLKELTVWGCRLAWSDMAMIASLPHLELLKLQANAVSGAEWIFSEEIFPCLRHLRIDCCDLVDWIAESSNFPVLETLSLWNLSNLNEIPSGIGDIPTLEIISITDCSESTTISAVNILMEQENLENLGLQLTFKFEDETEAETWRGKIQELGFTSKNLLINGRETS
ncbi:hypothetical protein C2S51_006719 [Perilla frutescens var. frutescens]|nr:hypothetical protein C2S51_006719 [Perilla frutescens var. frutescens]